MINDQRWSQNYPTHFAPPFCRPSNWNSDLSTWREILITKCLRFDQLLSFQWRNLKNLLNCQWIFCLKPKTTHDCRTYQTNSSISFAKLFDNLAYWFCLSSRRLIFKWEILTKWCKMNKLKKTTKEIPLFGFFIN